MRHLSFFSKLIGDFQFTQIESQFKFMLGVSCYRHCLWFETLQATQTDVNI